MPVSGEKVAVTGVRRPRLPMSTRTDPWSRSRAVPPFFRLNFGHVLGNCGHVPGKNQRGNHCVGVPGSQCRPELFWGPWAPEAAGRRPTLGPRAQGPMGCLGCSATQCWTEGLGLKVLRRPVPLPITPKGVGPGPMVHCPEKKLLDGPPEPRKGPGSLVVGPWGPGSCQ